MEKRIINIDDCCIGDKVALDVITETGAVIITEGTVLNEFIINKLKKLDISQIYIYSDSDSVDSINNAYEELKKNILRMLMQ
ncbi:hypothetical protein PL321_03545 [Caloramator sp. mosi_1]|uniref:hypothetical protein n=1 Tax=Caloramator sp. mosi_1 TaxID=3023090 RepID=UPI002360792F|nr:hypothetical protein [Caloramator sp. mosi_1]WDC84737.1 hypothetical protein PL321_03545 [Caloramator sp. mosi_1]